MNKGQVILRVPEEEILSYIGEVSSDEAYNYIVLEVLRNHKGYDAEDKAFYLTRQHIMNSTIFEALTQIEEAFSK